MSPTRTLSLLLTVLTLCSARALEPHAGFRDIPWGASEADILAKNLGKVVSTNLVYIKQFNDSEEGAVLNRYFLLPPTKELVIEGKRKELLRFFLVRDRLCIVLRRPDLTQLFAPARVIEETSAELGGKPVSRSNLKLPSTWGRLAPSNEKFETLDWETDKGLVRAACRTWPGNERREVFYVCHLSKEKMAENQAIFEEERRKAEEEARRKAEEERKAAEAAAKAKAAAQGTPPKK
jgi:hypothetical protein